MPVFGENLRVLTAVRGTQAKVSNDLDIGRVQFQRYLRGESFPKPNVLKRICDYFAVDARILTDPLSDQLLVEMLQARNPHAQFPHRGPWLSALEYAAPKPDFFDASTSLEEGLYVSWQWCGARKNTVIRRRFRVYRHNGATVFRGYAPREFYAPGTSPKKREYRGICLNLKTQGFVLLSFFATPSAMIGMIYVSPTHLSAASSDLMVGYSAITRDELPDMPRLSRILIERIDSSPAALVKESRAGSFYTLDNIPREYADLLGASVG